MNNSIIDLATIRSNGMPMMKDTIQGRQQMCLGCLVSLCQLLGYLRRRSNLYFVSDIMGVNSKSFPNNISQILPKFTNINVSLGKFVYRHNNSSEVYSYFLNLRCFRS